MTLKLLLLILVLKTNLITQQVHCKEDEDSGDAETEEAPSPLLLDETAFTELYPQTLTPQTFPVLLEEKVAVESYPQVVSTKIPTIQSKVNSTQNQNVTQKQNLTRTTDSPPQHRVRAGVKNYSTTAAPHTTLGYKEETDVFIIIVVLLVITLVITAMVVLINRKKRREKEAALKQDPYLDAEGGEKVPMPMFEDDVPSVMELEMEDLEKWMIKGDDGISMDSKQKQQFS
ncbi:transmembrane protein 154 isoform X1 [Astyanax mexicanus]|uniref:Transmembrane protein 154 isoform X1 n=1 Tax=Astyanax mexicanus TaxID=7994 RepID=A0A8T2KJ55_ASTMX|nr:transmembrane protein 154 isoform X1 [Astyanax mexicanus]